VRVTAVEYNVSLITRDEQMNINKVLVCALLAACAEAFGISIDVLDATVKDKRVSGASVILQQTGETSLQAKPDAEGKTTRVTRATNERVRTWVYEPDGTGYVPLAAIDQPLGKSGWVGKPTIHYVHTDHLGTPQEMTDENGRISWSADYSARGERQHSLVLNSEEEAERRTDCAIRFQGQYFDAETGLHYNTFRYYDPGCGRFISPDPINIEGGLNLYQYAPNAANWIDPWGWACHPNKTAGTRREQRLGRKLDARFGKQNVLRERYLLDANGKIVRDGTGRRIDFVVVGRNASGKKVGTAVEVTSKTARKNMQMAKENAIRGKGGIYAKDPATGELIEVVNTSRIIRLE
jgi:RHS repeat-associated protein